MGIYLNPGNVSFQISVSSEIAVCKSTGGVFWKSVAGWYSL